MPLVSHDASEILLICGFGAQEKCLIIINVVNSLMLLRVN